MNLPAFSKPASQLIAERYSCRAFDSPDPSTFAALRELIDFARSVGPGPLGRARARGRLHRSGTHKEHDHQ